MRNAVGISGLQVGADVNGMIGSPAWIGQIKKLQDAVKSKTTEA